MRNGKKEELRVWWFSDFNRTERFFVPVNSIEEARKVLDILESYELFQSNEGYAGGLEVNSDGKWVDWVYDNDELCITDIDIYIKNLSPYAKDLESFSKALFSQVKG